MAPMETDRSSYRPERHRIQRAIRASEGVIERTMSWLSGYRRLSPRYERQPRNYVAFLGLAAALCCYKRLVGLTT